MSGTEERAIRATDAGDSPKPTNPVSDVKPHRVIPATLSDVSSGIIHKRSFRRTIGRSPEGHPSWEIDGLGERSNPSAALGSGSTCANPLSMDITPRTRV